ncbi:MAG: glycine--tRNA ligase subunit beta [Candidatus Omnitrophica bacterium]|nr:glycine--tRNA ligase subunit beta [Candidatus Omnitrophota bacterium]
MKKNLDFILEIGTEELSLQDMRHSLKELPLLAEEILTRNNISFKKTLSFATPRRIVLYLKGIADRQADNLIEVSGPPKDIAFDKDGNPTEAAKGFARSQKVKVSQLVVKYVGKKEVVCAVSKKKGKPTSAILRRVLPDLLRSLSFTQPMRWGKTRLSFSRPIRWILALLDEKTIRFRVENLNSSNLTYGHRFLSPGPFRVRNPANYFDTLQKNFVILDREIRASLIRKGLEEICSLKGRKVDEDLIREAGDLVEYPALLCCSIEKQYLKILPERVIESAVKRGKGIPFRDGKGNLLPLFAIVANGSKNKGIKSSYEEVLGAKLADSKFFYQEDLRKPFEKYGEELKKIIFHNQLGTTFDRVKRMEKLAGEIGKDLGLKDIANIERGALLCKNDLATQMVREFPELQGFVGGHYGLLSGENELTSQIIEEHYLPRFPGDSLPTRKEAMAVGIADRLIAICGYLIIGIDLSASSDPYGVRRLANGLIEIVWKKRLKLHLPNLLKKTVSLFPSATESVYRGLVDFFKQRINLLLANDGIPADIRAAILIDLSDPVQIREKAISLKIWKKTSSASASLEAFSRVTNILKQAENWKIKLTAFRKELLKEEAEKKLFSHYQNMIKDLNELWKKEEYQEYLKKLEELKPSIDSFFDNVLVMEKNEVFRNNRLALLSLINQEFSKLADFSELEITNCDTGLSANFSSNIRN